jgi:hypothetical protein
MIPQTIGAVLAFLGLVAPGLLFELRRERRRPRIEETAFREASRVALTSLIFTLLSLSVLSIVRARRPAWMPDPGLWLEQGHRYAIANYRLIARTLLLEIFIACTFALLVERLFLLGARGDIVPGSIWFHMLRRKRPSGAKPWLHVRLKDETEFWGYLGAYSTEDKIENREITLIGPKHAMKTKGSNTPTFLTEWAGVAISAEQISFLRITYKDNQTGVVVPPSKSTSRGLVSLLPKKKRARPPSGEHASQKVGEKPV